MGRLFFRMYHAGLSNCRMSLDVGVGLAHLTGRVLVPFAVQPPWSGDPAFGQGVPEATILDLFDVPVPISREHAGANAVHHRGLASLMATAVHETVLRVPPAPPVESGDFVAFRNGRPHVATLDGDDGDRLVDTSTLGMASYFFYAHGARRSALLRALAGVRPKRPYREAAARIAGMLAPYNAVHVRRGDFRHVGLCPRAADVSGDEVAANLASRLDPGERLVVCTDGSPDDGWFSPIRRRFRDVVFLDRLLLEHEPMRRALRELPHCDDTVAALVTQLVAAEARTFVGTLFSTFSALIQRTRGLARGDAEFLYCYSAWDPGLVPYERCAFTPAQDGPYSWNRILFPVHPCVVSWFRDWPEAFREAPADAALPGGTTVLRARDARVHGRTLRYEQSDVHDNIGYWTDRRDYVTWDLSVPGPARYHVEACHACPDDVSGSTYRVGIEGGAAVAATVTPTGAWTSYSGWRPLGTLDLTEGRHTLAVRVVDMRAGALMNLSAVRLVPVCA
jgi:hypothetical protein